MQRNAGRCDTGNQLAWRCSRGHRSARLYQTRTWSWPALSLPSMAELVELLRSAVAISAFRSAAPRKHTGELLEDTAALSAEPLWLTMARAVSVTGGISGHRVATLRSPCKGHCAPGSGLAGTTAAALRGAGMRSAVRVRKLCHEALRGCTVHATEAGRRALRYR
jgi:hypothetical protein